MSLFCLRNHILLCILGGFILSIQGDQVQQPSRTADNLLKVHSKHFFTHWIRSDELYNFTPARKLCGTDFLTNADVGVHLQANYNFP